MWKVRREGGHIVVRGDGIYAIIDPDHLPEDYEDLDFVILTKKPKKQRLVDEILQKSKATLVGTPAVVKKFSKRHYVEEVNKVRGLAPGLWVAPVKGDVVVTVEGLEEHLMLIGNETSREEAERLGLEIYGVKGRIVLRSKLDEEEVE